MYLISLIDSPRLAGRLTAGAFVSRLSDEIEAGDGTLELVEIRPGFSSPGIQPAREHFLYIRAGSARLCTDGTDDILRPGDFAFLPPNELAATLRNEGLEMLQVFSVSSPPTSDRGDAAVVIHRLEDDADDDAVPDRFGNTDVRWSNVARGTSARDIEIGTIRWPPVIGTDWHRHDDADEFQLILDGAGTYWTEDGRVDVQPGQLAYIEAGVRHKFRASRRSSCLGVTGLIRRSRVDA